MMKGALMTQIILWFMGIWNDYLAPTIFVQNEKWYTLQVVIRSFNDQYAVNSNYPLIMAASSPCCPPCCCSSFSSGTSSSPWLCPV